MENTNEQFAAARMEAESRDHESDSSLIDFGRWSSDIENFVSEISDELTAIVASFDVVPAWSPSVEPKTALPTEDKTLETKPAPIEDDASSDTTDSSASGDSDQSSDRLQNLKSRLASLTHDIDENSGSGDP